jgi:hypothetical protein
LDFRVLESGGSEVTLKIPIYSDRQQDRSRLGKGGGGFFAAIILIETPEDKALDDQCEE